MGTTTDEVRHGGARDELPRRALWSVWLAVVGLLVSVCAVAGSPRGAAAAADLNMVPLVPARLLETRPGAAEGTVDGAHEGVGTIAAGSVYTLDVAGRGGVAADADAVMLNVTAVRPDRPGYLTVFPCTNTPPHASNVNYFAGDVSPNSVLAKLSDDGNVCIFSLGTTHAVVDVTGYVPTGGAPVPVDPGRLVETRNRVGEPTVDGRFQGIGRAGAGDTIKFEVAGRAGVPANAEAVYLNVTAVRPGGPGHLTVYPCTGSVPDSSNVNYRVGDVAPNAVLATLSPAGEVCIYTHAATDIIADVNAYLPPGGNRVPIEPARCADTRNPGGNTFDGLFEGDGKIAPGDTYVVTIAGRCNIAPDASAAYLNVTALNAEAPGYLTVWPCDEPRPGTSNVNYRPGGAQPNGVLSKISLDGNGNVCIYSLARTDVIVDANGYVPAASPNFVQIQTGDNQSCALDADGELTCWGYSRGLLGADQSQSTTLPVDTPNLEFSDVAMGDGGPICGVLVDATAVCWGDDPINSGVIGNGTPGAIYDTATPVSGLTDVVQIDVAAYHACAVTGDGAVHCWGQNAYEQLGDGTTDDRHSPVEATVLPAGASAVEVATGISHTCALLDDGGVFCWGYDVSGQLGDDANDDGVVVDQAGVSLGDVVQIDAGNAHTCAIRSGGSVWCWGITSNYEVTDPGPTPDTSRAYDTGVTDAVDLGLAQYASCAVRAGGEAVCWGEDGHGRLGNGPGGHVDAGGHVWPPDAALLDGPAAGVALSREHACWVLDDGNAQCAGRNFYWATGTDADSGDQPTPVRVIAFG